MKNKIQAMVVGVLIAAIGAFGFFETLEAAPDGSQRLRGMDNRAFRVDTVPSSVEGPYCYYFNSGGEWIDERFTEGFEGPPVPGTWEQDSVGAATSYTAAAEVAFQDGPFLIEIILEQEGHVTPARGRGVLQLEAYTDVYVNVYAPDGNLVFEDFIEVVTMGYEDPNCGSDLS